MSDENLSHLARTIRTTLSLVDKFASSLKVTSSPSGPRPSSASTTAESRECSEPLPLLLASATLIRAHATKLSLLTITPPFTPTALSTVLQELSTGPLPTLLAAFTTLAPSIYTHTLHSEVHFRISQLLHDLRDLVSEVSVRCDALPSETYTQNYATEDAKRNQQAPSLTATGQVWADCDALISIGHDGLAGVMVSKAQGYRDLLVDAIAELDAWSKEETVLPDDEDNDNDSDEEEEDEENEIFPSTPNPTEAIRPTLTLALKRLVLIKHLFTAVVKHRLRHLPSPSIDLASKLDRLIKGLCAVPDAVDDLASAFYDLDVDAAVENLARCVALANEAVEPIERRWDHTNIGAVEDPFSSWLEKWKDAVGAKPSSNGVGA
ncbi:MAG: hypothetical protein M1825_002137 [Sarcosagium campestre]|nr:MAG: hypothetical protein M1825_002137 [Sarcosagium campestre]